MKPLSHPLAYAAVLLALLMLPSPRMRSQVVAPLPDDPLSALQVLQKSNDDLLKRQDDTLKALTDATAAANEIRIFSHRG